MARSASNTVNLTITVYDRGVCLVVSPHACIREFGYEHGQGWQDV